MPHQSYPAGRDGNSTSWPGNVGVASSEFAWLAKGVYQAINETGGVYALEDNLTIGGHVVTINSVLNAGGVFNALSTVNIISGTSGTHGAFNIGAYVDTTFSGNIVFNGTTFQVNTTAILNQSLVMNGGTSGTHAAVSLGAYVDLTCGGLGHFESNVTFDKSVFVGTTSSDLLDVLASVGLHAPVTHSGSAFTLSGGSSGAHSTFTIGQYYNVVFSCDTAVAFTGTGGISNAGPLLQSGDTSLNNVNVTGIFSQPYLLLSGSTSYTIPNTKKYIVVLSASSTVTLTAAGPSDRFVQTIINHSASSLAIHNPGGSSNCTIDGAADGASHWVDMMWDGSSFFALRWGGILS